MLQLNLAEMSPGVNLTIVHSGLLSQNLFNMAYLTVHSLFPKLKISSFIYLFTLLFSPRKRIMSMPSKIMRTFYKYLIGFKADNMLALYIKTTYRS